MLPYAWPHPTWNMDPRHHHYYANTHSQTSRVTDRQSTCPCRCDELRKEVDMLKSQINAVLKHLAQDGLHHGGPSTHRSVSPEQSSKKRKLLKSNILETQNKTSTIIKRRKQIQDLEQQVAIERADNQKMEARIAEMKIKLVELRRKRLGAAAVKEFKETDNVSNCAVDSEGDTADEYESDNEDGLNKNHMEEKRFEEEDEATIGC